MAVQFGNSMMTTTQDFSKLMLFREICQQGIEKVQSKLEHPFRKVDRIEHAVF